MWDVPAWEPDPRYCFDLLGNVYYHYDAPPIMVRQVRSPSPVQEEAAQEEVTVVEYQPLELSEEKAIKESDLLELSQWEGVPVMLQESSILLARTPSDAAADATSRTPYRPRPMPRQRRHIKDVPCRPRQHLPCRLTRATRCGSHHSRTTRLRQ
jgi:hypothetical protein